MKDGATALQFCCCVAVNVFMKGKMSGTRFNNMISAFAKSVYFTDDKLCVVLMDGREINTPLTWFPKLSAATKEQLNNWRFIGRGLGIHWEELDEDISIEGLLK